MCELELDAFLAASACEHYYPALAGLTLNILGDSYFAGEGLDPTRQVWSAMLATKYGMTFDNFGIGGSTMADPPIRRREKNPNPMVHRYTKMPENQPDLVLLEGGRNDYNFCVPLGEDGTSDIHTYKGAVRTLIEGLRAKYPKAVLVCVTAWRTDQTKTEEGVFYACNDYPLALRSVCEAMDVPCIYAADPDVIPVKMYLAEFREKYSMTPKDHSHMQESGMRMVLPYFERVLAQIYCEARGLPLVNQPKTE